GRVNYLAGRVVSDQDNNTNPYVITIRTLYALNYWDYNLAKTAFRDNSSHTGVYIGYVAPVEDSKITTDVGQLNSIKQITFNGKDLFDISGSNGSVKLVSVAKNDADLFGNSTDLSIKLNISEADLDKFIKLNDIYEIDSKNFAHVTTFLTELLNVNGGEIWDRYWGEYPELRLGNKIDECDIYTAEQLIKQMNEMPYKTFRIMNDLDFTGINTFVTKTFTGKLLSARTNDKDDLISTNFYNIDFKQVFNDGNDSVGFFKFTKRATVTNINFYVKGGDYSSKNVLRFGVVSAQDEASSFNNVRVICVSGNVTQSNAKRLSLGTLKINGVKVGGFTGDASGTIVLNGCSYTGGLELANTHTSTKDLYLGGLVGYSSIVKLYDRTTVGYFTYSSNIQFGTYIQKSDEESEYGFILTGSVDVTALPSGSSSVKVSKTDSMTNNLYVGGLVGYNSSMLAVNNASIQNKDNGNVAISVNSTASYIRVGGLAGTVLTGSIKNFSANVSVSVTNGLWVYAGGLLGESTNAVISNVFVGGYGNNSKINVSNVSAIVKIGGVVGSAIVTSMNASNLVNQTNAYVDINFSGNAKSLAIGGVYGEFSNFARTSVAIQNNRINAYGSITADTAQYMYIGGLVGNNVLMSNDSDEKASATTINYSYSGMEINVNAQKIAYVGGIIGNAENMSLNNLVLNGADDYLKTGSLEIINCLASGYIELDVETGFDHIYAGGIAGDTKDAITNTVILTTIIKPEYGNANKNKYSIDVVAGVNNNDTKNTGIVVVDEVTGSRFESSQLLTSDNNTVRFANSDVYTIKDYADFISEFNSNALTIYTYIKEVIEVKSGSVFNPIKVSSASQISSIEKTYHILTSNITISSSKSINGVLAGNYKKVTTSRTMLTTIGKYGVVGNFAILSSSSGASGALLAGTNNGIIHDIYATGKVSGSSVGGLVKDNKGMILNAIVDVELIASSGKSGMIASTSTNGTIFNCFTLGGLVANGGTAVGTVVGESSNTLYKFVNSVTSLDTKLNSSSAGFIGKSASTDKFVYCSFDAQALTRNSLPLSNSTLKVLEFDKYLSSTINTSSSYYMLYVFNTDTNSVCRADNKNFGYAYFPRFESFIKTTIVNGYTYVNNFSAFYKLLDTNYTQGVKIKLAYNINQDGFDVKGSNVNQQAWTPKCIDNFVGELDGNGKRLKGLSITGKKYTYSNRTDYLVGLFYSITSTSEIQSKITNLNLVLKEATNFITEYSNYKASSNVTNEWEQLDSVGSYSGALAGIIYGTASNKVVVDNVEVSFIKSSQVLYGNSVGGLCGYAENAVFTNCGASGFKVQGFNMTLNLRYQANGKQQNTIINKYALTSGFVGTAQYCEFSGCTTNLTVTGDNGFDGSYFYGSTFTYKNETIKASSSSLGVSPYGELVFNSYAENRDGSTHPGGVDGTNASPIAGFVAYGVSCKFSNCTNSGTLISGHAGNGSDAIGYDENHKGKKGGNGGAVFIGGIAGIQDNCTFTNTRNNCSYGFVADADHATAAGKGGNGSDGANDATNCCAGNGGWCWHGSVGSSGSCSDVSNGRAGGNGGNGGYSLIGNLYASNTFLAIYPSNTTGETCSLLCSAGGNGGKGSKGGAGGTFSLIEGLKHWGGDSGLSGYGGKNGNGELSEDYQGKINGRDGTVGGPASEGGKGGESTPCYLVN
ncbi:MAG: GLUG motif-containing protein, partial [Christensenellales bacterium]